MKLQRGILLALILLSACKSGSESPEARNTPETQNPQVVVNPGIYPQAIVSGGVKRNYLLYVPQGYDGSKALPLVFLLHGHGMSAESMMKSTRMNEKADQENFFAVYPQGTVGPLGKTGWNTGSNDDVNPNIDDVAFIRDLAIKLEGQLNVDSKRIYASGLSFGAAMSHRLAAELPDILAGVAVVAGAIGNSVDGGVTYLPVAQQAKSPISVLILHGYNDTHVLYDGGQGVIPGLNVLPVSDAVAFWTQADGCTDTPPPPQFPSTNNIQIQDFTACTAGSEVELIAIQSGEHEWPRRDNHAHFAGNDAIWEFFSRHPKGNEE